MTDTAVTPPRSSDTTPSRLTPAALLLVAGTVLLLSAAAVFAVREWERLGLAGQALVLAGATVAMGAGAVAAWRRRLRGTAEALASVTAGLAVLDAAGARVHGLAGAAELSTAGFVTVAGALIGGVASVAAHLAGRRRRGLVAAGMTACGAVPVTAVAAVAWLAASIRAVLPDGPGPAPWVTVGTLEGLIAVGLLLLVVGRSARTVRGTDMIALVARITGASLLAVLAVLTLVTTAGVLLGGARGVADAAATAAAPRLAFAGVVGLLLAAWPAPSGLRPVAIIAGVAGWVGLGGAVAAVAAWAGADPQMRVLAGVLLPAVTCGAAALRLRHGRTARAGTAWDGTARDGGRVAPVRDAAAWTLVGASGLATAFITALSVERLVALARAGVTGETLVPDSAVARALLACALVVAAGLTAALVLPGVRAVLRHVTPAVVTVAAVTLVWSLTSPPPLTATLLAGAVAGTATVAVVATSAALRARGRTMPTGALAALIAGIAVSWLGSFAAASGEPGTFGAWLALAGVTAAVAAAVGPRTDGVAADGVAAAGLAVGLLGLGLAGGELRGEHLLADGRLADGLLAGGSPGGALLVMAASAVASWVLVATPAWQLTRLTAAVAGGAAAAGPGLSLTTHGPAVTAFAAGGLLAQAVAGSLAPRGRRPFLPAVVRHVAVPGSAAWLSVELLALTAPTGLPGIDAGALPAVAVLGVAALYLAWLLAPRHTGTAAALTGRGRVLVRDLVLPATLALLAASTVAALLPLVAPLPVHAPMIPLLAVLVAIAVNASVIVDRADPAQPVPLVWVRDVVLRVTESLAALVALHALHPRTGLAVEYEVAVVAAITLAAHAARTAVARARGRLAPGVTAYDLVTLASAVALGVLGLVAGESPLWVSGATWLLNGAWGLVVAVLVRGPLAGPFPGPAVARGWLAVRTGAATATIGYLLMLTAADRVVVDAVTVPVGVLLVAFGTWSLVAAPRGPRAPSSLRTVGPGLVMALVPGAVLAVTDPGGWRPVLVAAAATAVALAGAVLRWRAPLLVGVAVVVSVAAVQASPVAAAVDGWVWLAVGGALTLGLGATFEDQVRRARAAGRAWTAMR